MYRVCGTSWGTAGTAAGGNGEEFPAGGKTFFLVGAHDRVLETGRVGGVAGDGDIHVFLPHDGNAFADVIGAVAADCETVGVAAVFLFGNDFEFAGVVIEFGFHAGEAVDTGDDLGGVFAETVQDHAQFVLTDFVGGFRQTDSAFRSREGFVTGSESEAFGVFGEQHGSQVAVSDTDFAVIRDGTGDAEALETFAERLGDFAGDRLTAFDGNGGADEISPAGVLKADGLNVFDTLIDVQTFGFGDFFGFLDGGDAVVVQKLVDLSDSAFITFEKSHDVLLNPCAG